MASAIKIGPGVKGVRIENVGIEGFDVGVDVGAGAEVALTDTRIHAKRGIIAGPNSKVTLANVTFDSELVDLLTHFTSDLTFFRTVAGKLEVYADDPAYRLPQQARDQLRRVSVAENPNSAARRLLRAIELLSLADWARERVPEFLEWLGQQASQG